jgi:ABC-type multidrug transport system fused ATPase/permease subunit
MNIKNYMSMGLLIFFVTPAISLAEDFVIKKRKPQTQSMNKLKEDYANELAELIKMIPHLQKQFAALQEDLINELYKIIDDEIKYSKAEIDALTYKTHELGVFLEQLSDTSLPAKSLFIKQGSHKKGPSEIVPKNSKPC